MLEEYDFRNDTVNANLDIDLKPATVIRPYQETSLSKMFGNGYSLQSLHLTSLMPRSAVVHDPGSSYCLAEPGKRSSELLPHVRSRSLVLFSVHPRELTVVHISSHVPLMYRRRVSVMQWKQQFMLWSNVTDRQIAVFTADQKEKVRRVDFTPEISTLIPVS